jgi:hypothetical protein
MGASKQAKARLASVSMSGRATEPTMLGRGAGESAVQCIISPRHEGRMKGRRADGSRASSPGDEHDDGTAACLLHKDPMPCHAIAFDAEMRLGMDRGRRLQWRRPYRSRPRCWKLMMKLGAMLPMPRSWPLWCPDQRREGEGPEGEQGPSLVSTRGPDCSRDAYPNYLSTGCRALRRAPYSSGLQARGLACQAGRD